jgi:hypothetical protein
MKKHAIPVISVVAVVALFAAFAVPAFAAGNGGGGAGNGGGGQSDNAPAADHAPGSSDAPGNSANAPGQEKKAEPAAPQAAGSSTQDTTAHGQTNKPDSPATGHAQTKKTYSSAGVKPSNSTSHNVSAPAGLNATKLYGNGQTAGQIAIANGASADTPLYGPGNSQPHKTTPCGQAAHGNGGGYDVHALKSHARQTSCTDTDTRSPTGEPTKDPTPNGSVGPTTPRAKTQPTSDAQSPSPAVTADSDSREAADVTNGVLGAVSSTTTGTTLPFTGLPLWLVVLVATAATGAGLALRRQARSIA